MDRLRHYWRLCKPLWDLFEAQALLIFHNIYQQQGPLTTEGLFFCLTTTWEMESNRDIQRIL